MAHRLILSFVALFAVIGLVITLVPSYTPKGFIDYNEQVESCAGGKIFSESQVQGKSRYVNYQSDTRRLHCYDYYTTIKRFGTTPEEKPTAGRCYKEKCCWAQKPSERTKRPPTQRWLFDTIRSWFRYSPAAEVLKGKEPLGAPWFCYS